MKGNLTKSTGIIYFSRAVLFFGLLTVLTPSGVQAQYGPRCWTPPFSGNFYSLQMGGTNFVPTPFLPFDPTEVPVYPVLGMTDSYVYDDTLIDLSAGLFASDVPAPPGDPGSGGSGDSTPPYVRTYGSNDLWLELLSFDSVNQQAYFRLHGTVPDDHYQLLATNQLSEDKGWTLAEIVSGVGATNQTDFSAFNTQTNSKLFFRAHHADPILAVSGLQDAIEPSTVDPGRSGFFRVLSYTDLTTNLTVLFTVGGTAQIGTDYSSNITHVVTLSPNNLSTNIEIVPLADNLIEGAETVTLTIQQTNDFLIDPDSSSATILIKDSPTTVGVYSYHPTAIEPNGPPGVAALNGTFEFLRNDDRGSYPQRSIFYAVTGTASNGVDYVTLTNSFVFPANEATFFLDVIPLADTILEGIETVTLTLVPTNTYVVDSSNNSQTVNIVDSSTTVSIAWVQDAIETNSSLGVGQIGIFKLSRTDSRGELPSLTAIYQLSGTASNGLDYTMLNGTITFAAGASDTNVFVETLPDNLVEGTETVILTVVTNGVQYYVDQDNSASIVKIQDSVFFLTVTNFPQPVGIDYHSPSNSIIFSHDGGGTTFERIFTNITVIGGVPVTNAILTNWSSVSGVPTEVKVATVRMPIGTFTNSAGFTNGDLFFGSGTQVGLLTADATRSNLSWCTLTNSTVTNALLLRGGLYVDETGTFSNHLIAVTSSDGTLSQKGVWSIDSNRNPHLLAQIFTEHLEGVTILTNDVQRWGPWAGKIITGDESHLNTNTFLSDPVIYTISTNGTVNVYHTTDFIPEGIYPEDFDVIPPNQNLYITAYDVNAVMELPAEYFVNSVGDLLITQAGENGPLPGLFIVHWNGTSFVTTSIPIPNSVGGHIEHVTFAPLRLPGH